VEQLGLQSEDVEELLVLLHFMDVLEE